MLPELLQLVVYEPQGVNSSLRPLGNGIINLFLDDIRDVCHLACQQSDVLVCALDAVKRRFNRDRASATRGSFSPPAR